MKKFSASIILLIYCFLLISCSSYENEYNLDDAEFAGVLRGHYEAFTGLWNATGQPETLAPGKPWQTEHFTLTLTDTTLPGVAANRYEDRPSVEFKLNTTSLTLEECVVDEKLFFYARELGNDVQQNELLLGSNDFFWAYAESCNGEDYDNFLKGKSCRAVVALDQNCSEVQIIIIIENCVYKARYQPANTQNSK